MHVPGEEEALLSAHGYAAEDHEATRELLSRTWSAVVGNPPYIAVADAGLRAAYKRRFPTTCTGKWTLGMPFIERFWQLAHPHRDASGYIGLIVDNSFMKREKGKQLVEQWFPSHDLTHLIDVSGAYIPGHGTPTVILCGRNRVPLSGVVRTVMGIRGEPSTPVDPERGLVWSSITELVDEPGSQSEYVSVVDLARERLSTHPWSIGGGGAAELKEYLDHQRSTTLGAVADAIGPTAVPGTDEVYVLGEECLSRARITLSRPYVTGDLVRDYATDPSAAAFPYDGALEAVPLERLPRGDLRWYWTYRFALASYLMFGKRKSERGLQYHEWGYLLAERLRTPFSIAFAFVATHNHFAFDRGGAVFNRHAPVIKLPVAAGEDRYLELLGVLNSSTACFWMKQVFHNKGASVDAKGARQTTVVFENFYEHDSTKLKQFPLPGAFPLDSARRLDQLARDLAAASPAQLASRVVPGSTTLADAKAASELLRAEMIAAQEQLDWECYRLYGLAGDDLTSSEQPEPPLQLGERAFEIALARRIAAGDEESSWFARHRSTPITELPAHWTANYRALVERRVELIETDLNIGLIEKPEHKRRWAAKSWDEQLQNVLRSWLLDRLEETRYWPEPAAITTVARLTAGARADADFVQVACLYVGRDDVDLAPLIADLVKAESVAYLAAHRYTEAGSRKHAEWLRLWQLQGREDAGEDVGAIAVPPKYAKADFAGAGWEHRGKLDVPKERFISYPGAERETDASAVVGWAGWDHLERARALAAWYLQAKRDGRDAAHLTPLLGGLAELIPWLKQWYDEPNANPMLDRPGSQVAALVDTELRSLGLTHDDLLSWRPPAAARQGRPRKVSS